jgi:hypothetical protein
LVLVLEDKSVSPSSTTRTIKSANSTRDGEERGGSRRGAAQSLIFERYDYKSVARRLHGPRSDRGEFARRSAAAGTTMLDELTEQPQNKHRI